MNKNISISDETQIPMKWVFILLSCSGSAIILTVGVMLWVSNVAYTADAVAAKTVEQSHAIEKLNDSLSSIDRRLANIEGALGVKRP